MSLWIPAKLSTAAERRMHLPFALTQAGCMTHNLSAGSQVPRAVPGPAAAGAVQPASAPQPDTGRQADGAPDAARTRRAATQASTPKSRRKPPANRARRSAATAGHTRSAPERRVRIGSPTGLLAVVPVLLQFQPSNSMVIIGTEPPGSQVRLTLRYDLPDPPDPALAAELAAHAVAVLAAQHINRAAAVGYGPGRLVTPVADALRARAPSAGITVTELLRVENQRYWSYLCAEPGCCPPEGTPFDVSGHPAARALAAGGAARVLSSRAELAASVAPLDGDAGEAMRRATQRAEEHVARLVSRVAMSGRRASARRLIATAGLQAVGTAIARYRRGESVGPEIAAWLTVVLRDLRVRDDAWSRMQPEHLEAHLRLWADLTRMARPGYASAPASLLAFVAWQSGNGALANVALDRALTDDPGYSMAVLLRQVLDSGAPPSLARLPMTPEEVAASYDDLEAPHDEDDECDTDDAAERP